MDVPIPREKIESGITAGLKRVGEYLDDADRLTVQPNSSQGTLQDAAILVTFGIQELGKAIILRKRSEEQPSDIVKVERLAFGGRDAHEHKQAEAFKSIDSGLKRLHTAGFGPGFGPNFDIQSVDISPETRLELSFVDFVNGDWVSPPLVEPKRLKALIEGAKEVLKEELGLQAERFKKMGDRISSLPS